MIRICELRKTYGRTAVLDGVDLEVTAGEIAAVVGPSGAGKSTLARCVNLLERPTSGTVQVDGQDLTQLRAQPLRHARRSIGTVFQSANLLSRLTVAQNVALPLRSLGLAEHDEYLRVRDMLERVGLLQRASHYPAQLSGGQRQRVGIARALALRPSVLLADEATSGLDPSSTIAILNLINELRADLGLTVVLITHEMDVVRAVADRVAYLQDGRITESGRVADVVRDSDSTLARALLPAPAAAKPEPGRRMWGLRYTGAAVNPAWLSSAAAELRSRVDLLSALIEQVGGSTVGRVIVGLDGGLDDALVRDCFARHAIVAEPVTHEADGRGQTDDRIASRLGTPMPAGILA